MKRMFLWMLLNTILCSLSNGQNFSWAKRAGLWAYDYGYGITTDNAGNVYLAGKYEMNANFSGTVVPCQGNHDIFIAKYSSSGSLLWVRTAGGVSGDYATAIAIDDSHVYIAGEIEGAGNKIKFVGSPVTLICQGSNDVFLAKYDLNGNLKWAKRAGGANWDKATGISVDNSGNVYIGGYFQGTSVFSSTSSVSSAGGYDMFIAKYDSNGGFLWVRRGGGNGRDESTGVAVDASGNLYVCGMFQKNANFSGTAISSNGNFDMYLAKYGTNGNLLWIKKAGSTWDDLAWSVTIDNSNTIIITGEFNSSVNFGGVQLTTSGGSDVFVAKYSNAGNLIWAKKAGGNGNDRARGIGNDGTNIFITGQFGGTAQFGNVSKSAKDDEDIFFSAMNNNGNFLWTSTVDGPVDPADDLGYESGISICAEPNGNVYASGALLKGGTFGSTALNPYSRTDIFITKLINGSGGGGGGSTGSTELIAANSSWKYLDNGSNQGITWRNASYAETGWKNGSAELGYGDGDETTIVSYGSSSSNKYITTYFRKTFNIINASSVSGIELSLIRDDGAVVYINGAEKYRTNMPGGTINYNTLSSTSAADEAIWKVANLSASQLVNGSNLVAVEIHQHSVNSSDLSFNLRLRTISGARVEDPQPEYTTEVISFNGQEKSNSIYLFWTTAKEEYNDYFILERGYDDENFEAIGIIEGSGNSFEPVNYSFVDSTFIPPSTEQTGTVYYRLNMTDYDGKAGYSTVISVDYSPLGGFSISDLPLNFALYPNPVKQTLMISVSETPHSGLRLVIYNVHGKLISESTFVREREEIDVRGFEPGVYLVGIKNEKELIFSEKIIIQP